MDLTLLSLSITNFRVQVLSLSLFYSHIFCCGVVDLRFSIPTSATTIFLDLLI